MQRPDDVVARREQCCRTRRKSEAARPKVTGPVALRCEQDAAGHDRDRTDDERRPQRLVEKHQAIATATSGAAPTATEVREAPISRTASVKSACDPPGARSPVRRNGHAPCRSCRTREAATATASATTTVASVAPPASGSPRIPSRNATVMPPKSAAEPSASRTAAIGRSKQVPADTVSHVDVLDTFGRPLRDLRISVTDRCNFRCVYCMPKEVYGRDHRFLDRARAPDLRGDRARRARLRRRGACARSGSRAASRSCAATSSAWSSSSRDLGRRPDADDERRRCSRRRRRRSRDAGLTRVTVSLDSLDDATFRALNDVDFPVERVLEGIDAAHDAGLPREGERGDQARRERGSGRRRWPRSSASAATRCASSSTWTSATRTAGASTTSCRRPRSSRATRRAFGRSSRSKPHYRGEVAQRWRYRDGGGEVGVIASVTAAVLRRLHTGPAVGRGPLVHLPFRGAGPRPSGADPRRRLATRSSQRRSRDRGARAADRYSELRSPATPACRRSRCPTSAGRTLEPPVASNGSLVTAVVAAAVDILPRGWSDLGRQLLIWFGFASCYQLARGVADRNPTKAFANGYHVIRHRDARLAPPLRADLPAVRRPAAPARHRRLLDVLELGVHGRRPRAALGLPPPARGVHRASGTRSCSRT